MLNWNEMDEFIHKTPDWYKSKETAMVYKRIEVSRERAVQLYNQMNKRYSKGGDIIPWNAWRKLHEEIMAEGHSSRAIDLDLLTEEEKIGIDARNNTLIFTDHDRVTRVCFVTRYYVDGPKFYIGSF